MDAFVISSIGVCIAVALGVAYALRRASSACQLPATIDWIDELSVERYRPILRLLGGEDFRFLRDQPGCTAAMVTRLRAQRCQIFKGYLRDLQGDFDQV